MKYYQQGDVLIKPLEKVVKEKLKEISSNVLKEGELTGHAHRITDGDYRLYENEKRRKILLALSLLTLEHEEHNTITIPKGEYVIDSVKEFDHFDEEAREVLD